MKLEPVDIINIIAIFQLTVFVFFLFKKKSLKQSNKILAAFLLIQIVIIVNFKCFNLYNYVKRISPHVFFVGTPFFFLVAPVFYLYVKSMVFSDFKLIKKHLLHTLPFDLVIIIFFIYFYRYPAQTKIELLRHHEVFSHGFWLLFNLVMFIQILIYFLLDIKTLNYYKKEIKEQFSSIKKVNLSWLTFITYCFLISWLTTVMVFISENYSFFPKDFKELVFINFFSFFLFFNYIFYNGFSKPEIFSGIEEKLKYASSKLKDEDAGVYLTRLLSYMDKEKPYLNPDLTLKGMAEDLSVPARYLSQIINKNFNQNFYDYISKHRIEEAKRILSDDKNSKTVLEVLYQVGFSSKSSFNAAFKKHTGLTPSSFKKKQGD